MFILPAPKNALEALRQAKTEAKANEVLASYRISQFAFFPTTGLTVYRVDNDTMTYYVDIRTQGNNSCTCADFKKHGDYCKHILACEYRNGLEAEQAAACDYEASAWENRESSYGCDFSEAF